jgi:hypothetical protein
MPLKTQRGFNVKDGKADSGVSYGNYSVGNYQTPQLTLEGGFNGTLVPI